MGRQGIRRRKPRRRLPKVRDDADQLDAPPVMWPDAGSGFEASPYSPAGRAAAGWRMLQGMRDANAPRWARVTMWVFALSFLLLMVISVLSSLTGLLS